MVKYSGNHLYDLVLYFVWLNSLDTKSSTTGTAIFLDCRPTQEELAVWQRVQEVLQSSATILRELHQYKGAANEIREVRGLCSMHCYKQSFNLNWNLNGSQTLALHPPVWNTTTWDVWK